LALRHGCELEREWLAGLLWPDSPQRAALHNLRNCLTALRSALGSEAGRLLSPHPGTLALDLTGASVDVLAFDAALARGAGEERLGCAADSDGGRSPGEALEEAVALYRGPLLDECAEEWVVEE